MYIVEKDETNDCFKYIVYDRNNDIYAAISGFKTFHKAEKEAIIHNGIMTLKYHRQYNKLFENNILTMIYYSIYLLSIC